MARKAQSKSDRGDTALDARAEQMADQYLGGATLEAIGQGFGLTRERVRQILVGAGYDTSTLRAKAARNRRERILQERGPAIHDLLADGYPPTEVASTVQVPLGLVQEIDAGNPDFARRRRQRRVFETRITSSKYTDEEVLGCLEKASDDLGGVLTTAAYTEYARACTFGDGRPWPTHQTAVLRFGSWRAGLEEAGLPSNPSTPIAGRLLFDEARCIDAILEVQRAFGHLPSIAEYEAYAASMEGVLPSVATVRHRLGGWRLALRAAAEFESAY